VYFLFAIILLFGALAFSGWCLYQYFLIREECNHLRRQLQTAKDENEKVIFEQKSIQQTESKLRNYLVLMDTLINTIPTPVYFKEIHGVYQGCNKKFAKEILGLTRDRIIGKRPQELPDQIPPELAATYQNQELRMLEKERMHSFEAQVQCADGVHRDFLFNLAPVTGSDHQIDACVAVLSDLTEKNHAIQDRLDKEKLQGVLETTGAVCHELNQPLQALSGYMEILSAKLSPAEDHAHALAKVFEQIDRMRDITDKLQGITRYEATDYANHTRIIDIHKASQK
jgi:PAS domain S-box-containing protein